ncbi:MAG TPA: hypothetical protein PKY35_09515 [Candidatus Hydrogenedentes bacterium]|nr:hypothetical protein [Candidatus Hydrogenedentota bacterium]HOL77256.1 hypothetical protein [Candidatus Hydrogenedentota bacterium]
MLRLLKVFLEKYFQKYSKIKFFFLAVLLGLPSVWTGMSADDYVIRSIVLQKSSLAKDVGTPLDTFAFIPSPEHVARGIEKGVYPWWTAPDARLAFWRPLSAATHWLDFHAFPNAFWLMHLENLLCYALLGVLCLAAYRRFMTPAWAASLAAFLYICDEAHGMSVGWLAARNALTAPVFAMGMFLCHVQSRERNSLMWHLSACLLLVLALLSGESAVSIGGYLFAYACFLDPNRKLVRFFALFPYAAIVVVWRIIYVRMGYAVNGTGLYIDPGKDTAHFLYAVLQRLPALLLGQLAIPNSGTVTMLPETWVPLYVLGALIFLGWVAYMLFPLWRTDRVSKFFALGMVLSAVPSCATLPNDRLLFFAGFGGMGLVARYLVYYWERIENQEPSVHSPRTSERFLASIWTFLHGYAAPVLLPVACLIPLFMGKPIELAAKSFPQNGAKSVIIANVPVDLMLAYVPMMLEAKGREYPPRTLLLTAGLTEVEFSREDEKSLIAHIRGGLFPAPWTRSFRDITRPFHEGERINVNDVQVEILGVSNDGRPERIRFTFPENIEDLPASWVTWSVKGFVPFDLPKVGDTVSIKKLPLFWWMN